jgi:phosphohistidine phosphatase
MHLYIVRHAWAGQSGDPRYPDDGLRPLTVEGRKRFRRLNKKLLKRSFDPAHIATSPLVRCRQTADVIAELSPRKPDVVALADLAPRGELNPLVTWTRDKWPEDVAWVGHAPDVEELTAALIGDARARIRFAKGAVACLEFADELAAGHGELIWLATAGMLGL